MMKNRKKSAAILAGMILVLQAAGCGNAEPPVNDSGAQSNSPASVEIEERDTISTEDGKILIAYFSAGENSDVDAVSSASVTTVEGEAKAVACFAAALLALLAAFLLLQVRLQTAQKRKVLEAEQRCRLKLYRQFYANPLHLLHRSSLGGNLENFSNDLVTVTQRLMTDRPGMAAAAAETLLFGVYLLWLSPLAGAIILGISLLQVIPPLIVRKYLQVNYDKCRRIEGDITNFIITAFQGFLLIKLYGLKDWWLGKLNEIYKRYWVIGNESVFANRSQTGM